MFNPANEIINEVPIDIKLENDYSARQNGDGTYPQKVRYVIPKWFIDQLNLVILNQNLIIKSELFKSIMGLDKAAEE